MYPSEVTPNVFKPVPLVPRAAAASTSAFARELSGVGGIVVRVSVSILRFGWLGVHQRPPVGGVLRGIRALVAGFAVFHPLGKAHGIGADTTTVSRGSCTPPGPRGPLAAAKAKSLGVQRGLAAFDCRQVGFLFVLGWLVFVGHCGFLKLSFSYCGVLRRLQGGTFCAGFLVNFLCVLLGGLLSGPQLGLCFPHS